MSKSFYITTTLPYVNADLHMGHALEFVRADIIARYKELQGFDIFFNTGTDEHGQKIYIKATEEGMSPEEFVDKNHARFREYVRQFGISDKVHFVRTSEAKHIKAAREFWKRVADRGFIYKKRYKAKYCVGCESEKTDSELVNGKCPDHPTLTIEFIDEENYFFKFSAFQKQIMDFYEKHPHFVIPDFRFNEIKSFVGRGLQDFSISRLKEKMSWGVEVPDDPKQVMYVWFEALTSYISTLGWPDNEKQFNDFWKNGTPTQYCGKDNIRFQAAIWQAMLMAADLPNSHMIVINGHMTAEGGVKMSKSLGNVADPKEIAAEYGTDALRYFLAREVSIFEDSPFTPARFKEAYNANLANGLGNLVSRVMKMSLIHLAGEKIEFPKNLPTDFSGFLQKFEIQKASDLIWAKISALDLLIQKTEPFKLVKTDKEKAFIVLRELLAGLAEVASMLRPILPETSEKIMTLLKENKVPETPLFPRKD